MTPHICLVRMGFLCTGDCADAVGTVPSTQKTHFSFLTEAGCSYIVSLADSIPFVPSIFGHMPIFDYTFLQPLGGPFAIWR